MKRLLLCLVFVVSAGCIFGCQESEEQTQRTRQPARTDSNPEPEPIDSIETYTAESEKLLDQLLGFIEPVDSKSEAIAALPHLKTLKNRAKELGKFVADNLASMKDDETGREQFVNQLENATSRKLKNHFARVEQKLGKSKSSSAFPELWEESLNLVNLMKNN